MPTSQKLRVEFQKAATKMEEARARAYHDYDRGVAPYMRGLDASIKKIMDTFGRDVAKLRKLYDRLSHQQKNWFARAISKKFGSQVVRYFEDIG